MVLGGLKMQIDVGYFYFIKDSFFDIIDDSELMKNKENGNKRPCYYCIKSKKYDNIIWFIPVSTKIDKYKRIYDSKIQKQIKLGKNPSIDTIVFGDVANTYSSAFSIHLPPHQHHEMVHMHAGVLQGRPYFLFPRFRRFLQGLSENRGGKQGHHAHTCPGRR